MRRSLTTLALSGVLLFQGTTPALAGAYATEFTQILNHGQLVMQYIRQGQQLQQQLRNLQRLPSQTYGPVAADLNSLASVVQGGMALAYSLANLDAQFRTRFPGYGYNSRTYYVDYRHWFQTSQDTTLGTLRAAGLQGQQLQNEQAVLSALRGMAQTADGHMQALQVANQIAEQQVQQLMKLRALMLVDLPSKQAFQAAQMQRQAAGEAAAEQFFSSGPAPRDGRTYLGGWR
jgi:P-type conjugative transfer protein TrbJ